MPKQYTKGDTAVDEILSGAERYDIKENEGAVFKSDMQIELATPVAEAGTNLDAARINNMENGIDLLDTKLADANDMLTTGGTSTAYTISTIGGAALATGETFRVKFHATAGSSPTLNRDSKGAKALKYYDATGTKQNATSAQIAANMILVVIYDGTDYVLLGGSSGGSSGDCVPGGRLTLSSGVPFTTSDVATATAIYYTPYIHNTVLLWNGAVWKTVKFTEKSLALGTVTNALPYDVFGYLFGEELTLEKLAWTNSTTRATNISLQDGRYCKTSDKTRLYLGTFYTISTTETCNTEKRRFLFNMYNRKQQKMKIAESGNWTYSTASWRPWNNSAANRFEMVIGVADELIEANFNGVAINSAGYSMGHGIGLDSTTTNSADTNTAAGSSGAVVYGNAKYTGYVPVGYHYLQALEQGGGSGTTTFYGTASSYVFCGMVGLVWM